MHEYRIPRTTLVAVLTATIAALIVRSWMQVSLVDGGMPPVMAANVSYLLVPPLLLLLLFPLWRSERKFLGFLFRRRAMSCKLALTAIAIGTLLQALWWSQVVAGASFGLYKSDNPDAIVGPLVSYACTSPAAIVLGLLVMAVLVPLVEEITHRGFIQTALQQQTVVGSILVSATVFAILHELTVWPFALFAGVVLGVQFWATQSLWSSAITHATANVLVQIDRHCLSVTWNPRPENIPIWFPGLMGLIIFAASLTCLLLLLQKMTTGARAIRPGSPGS